MATYPYQCRSCDYLFEFEMRMSEYDSKGTYPCPECASEDTYQIMTVPYVNFSGDGWASKNNRVAGQMKDKTSKQVDFIRMVDQNIQQISKATEHIAQGINDSFLEITNVDERVKELQKSTEKFKVE